MNGPTCIGPDGRTITRCVDCERIHKCDIARSWRWAHGPLPMECPLPRVAEETLEP